MMGAWLVTAGYATAIIGGAVLFVNTPPDVGGTYALMIPRSKGDRVGAEGDAIASRRSWNRLGFILLSMAALLQLGGYWADRLHW